MDKKRIPFDMPTPAHNKLADIADKLGFKTVTDLMRAAVADYCEQHGQPLTVEEMSLGPRGGYRGRTSERAES